MLPLLILLLLLLLLLLLHNLTTRNGITAVCVGKRDADTHIRTSACGGGGMPPLTIELSYIGNN